MDKEALKKEISRLELVIKRHRELAMWGNVESKERLRFLRSRKKTLNEELRSMRNNPL